MVIEVVFYLTYDAIFNVNNLVGLISHAAFMRHHDNRFVLFGIELLQELHHFDRGLAVQGARRFVGKDNAWLRNQGAGNGYTLLLSARHLVGIVVGPRQKAQLVKIVKGQLMPFPTADSLIEEWQLDVFDSCLEANQIETLKDKANHLVAVFGGTRLRKVFDERVTKHVFSTVLVVKYTENIQKSGLSGA